MKHKHLTIFISAAACLMLSSCYEMMLVPVYVTDRTANPGGYVIGDFDNKAGFDISYGNGSTDRSSRVSESDSRQNARDWPEPHVSQGVASMLILLDQARLDGHIVIGADSLGNARDSAAYTDTLTLVSTDEARVADWMLARIYERYIVSVDYDRQTATYTCRAYRRREQSVH